MLHNNAKLIITTDMMIQEVKNPHLNDFIIEETPLSCACARGFLEIMELLILNGADMNHVCSVSI